MGGATAAKYLKLFNPQLRVTVIEKNPVYVRPYGSSEVLNQHAKMDDLNVSYDALKSRYGIEFVFDTVTGLDPQARVISTLGKKKIGYDRLIENPAAYYITFDNKEVGRMQAREVFKAKPEGNYVFIKGASTDPNSDFLYSGQIEVLKEAMDAGKIKNVGEAYTDGWKPEAAQKNMEQFLTANNNAVDAVVSSNDGMAGGVVAALEAQGLAGAVPVSGQDGDKAALNRVALGTQTVSVWKDSRELGKKAAEIANELAAGKSMDEIEGTVKFSGGPKGVEMNSYFIAPLPITKENLNTVIDAGWISKEEACQGVAAGSVAACN